MESYYLKYLKHYNSGEERENGNFLKIDVDAHKMILDDLQKQGLITGLKKEDMRTKTKFIIYNTNNIEVTPLGKRYIEKYDTL